MKLITAVQNVVEEMKVILFEREGVEVKIRYKSAMAMEDANGLVQMKRKGWGFRNQFEPIVHVNPRMWEKGGELELLTTLAHELVHVRQHTEEGLEVLTDGTYSWKGDQGTWETEDEIDSYFLSPWELEARALQDWVVAKAIRMVSTRTLDALSLEI